MFGASSSGGGGDAPLREFQKGLDVEASRKQRMDERLSLRRKDRKEHIKKKRKKLTGAAVTETGMPADRGMHAERDTLQDEIPDYVRLENLDDFVKWMQSGELDDVFKGMQAIRQLLSVETKPPIAEVLDTGIVSMVLDIMRTPIKCADDSARTDLEAKRIKLQFEAAWAATNIASADSKFTRRLVDDRGVYAFVELIKNSRDKAAIDQAIWGLGNIAGDCPEFRDAVLETGVLTFILGNLKKFPSNIRRNAVWAVSNMCRGKPSPQWSFVEPCLLPLAQLMREERDYEILVDILWAISFISEDRLEDKSKEIPDPLRRILEAGGKIDDSNSSFQLDSVMEAGVVPQVIKIIEYASDMAEKAFGEIQELRARGMSIPDEFRNHLATSDFLMAPCTRILGNMVSGNDSQTDHVISNNFFRVIDKMIHCRVRNVRKEACWALSNVVAGTKEQLARFFSNEMLVNDVIALAMEGDINVRKEAGWCLSNAICGASFDQIGTLVRKDFLKAMIGLLSMMNIPKVLRMAMEAIDNALTTFNLHHGRPERTFNPWVQKCEEVGILEALEEIQSNDAISDKIANMAAELTMKFWPPESTYGPDVDGFDAEQGGFSGGVTSMSDATIADGGDTFGFGAGAREGEGDGDGGGFGGTDWGF
jgi:hypothetical protein